MERPIQVTVENGIARVFLDRPAGYNAFDRDTITELAERMTACTCDDEVKGVLLSGRGKAFCAGGDLKWVASREAGPGDTLYLLARAFHAVIYEIRRMKKPVVAAINGIAAGGGFSMALACDFRVMERSAVLRQAYTSSGLCIDGGGTFTLPRLVGHARALEIAAFDAPITAEKALAWGLVTEVVEDGQSVSAGLRMLERLGQGSLHSFGWVKGLLTDSFETPLETVLERERLGLAACSGHPDGREGIAAFVGKRRAIFGKK